MTPTLKKRFPISAYEDDDRLGELDAVRGHVRFKCAHEELTDWTHVTQVPHEFRRHRRRRRPRRHRLRLSRSGLLCASF